MKKRLLLKQLIISLLLVCLVGHAAFAAKVNVDFIDVGQGDAILIRSSEGGAVLIDAGTDQAGRMVVAPFIKELGIDKLSMVIMTHPHADHIGGLIPILEQIPVESIYADAQVHTSQTYEQLLLLIERLQIPFYQARAGMKLHIPGIHSFTVLHPTEPLLEGLNNNSVVVLMEAEGLKFLFTGDIEKQAEQLLLNKDYCLDVDVLKVAHHGSRTSSGADFIRAVNPKTAVIMVGEGNVYDHPHLNVLLRLAAQDADIYRTDQHGTISMTIEDEKMEISTYKAQVRFEQKLNLNTVTSEELQAISGIGKILAQRIIDYRQDVGFEKVDDLINVFGIGNKTLERIRDYFYVE